MTRRFLAAVGVALLGLATAYAAELRTWSDATGQFKIKAKFVSVANGKVTLTQEDGEELEIEVAKLSKDDQKYLATVSSKASANPFKKATPSDPFKAKSKMAPATSTPAATATAPAATAPAPAASEARLLVPDWSQTTTIDMTPRSGEWKFTVTPPPAAPKLAARPIMLPAHRNFFEGAKALVINAASKRAVIGYAWDDPKPAGSTRLALCDLENGKFLGTAVATGKLTPLALRDNGSQVLMKRDEFGFGNQDRIEIWNMGPAGLTRGLMWIPYDDLKGGDRDVKWASFLDAKRAVTVSNSGKLAIWDVDTAKPLSTMSVQGNCIPGISPDRKYLAYTTGKEVGILDLTEMAVVASQATPNNTPFPALIFSPSGNRLACLAHDRVFVWDFATGALYREIPYHGMAVMNVGGFATDDHLILGRQMSTLVDLANQVKLWQYQGAEFVEPFGGQCWFEVSEGDRGPGALVPVAIPGPNVKAALDRALADPNFFIVKPGVVMKVNVDAIEDPAEREKARAALTTKIQGIGCQVGPNGSIELVASTEVGKERELIFRSIGRFHEMKSYKVREYFSRVKLLYQGQPAWEASTINIPHIAFLKDGETMEEFLKKQEHPNYAYFSSVELPKFLTRPTQGSPTLGTSRVTTAGLR